MADASDLDERLRRLEQSRDALANQVAVLRSKEAERDRRKEADKDFMPVAIVLMIILVVLLGVMAVKGPPKNATSPSSSGFTTSPRPGG